MSFLDIFNPSRRYFSFDIKHPKSEFQVQKVSNDERDLLKIIHKLQKETFNRHIDFILRYFNKDFKNDKHKIKLSCLELASLYIFYFSYEFERNDIDSVLAQNYFLPIFTNFSDLDTILRQNNYQDLEEFLSVKSNYYEYAINNLKDMLLSNYFLNIFIRNPLVAGHPNEVYIYNDMMDLMAMIPHFGLMQRSIQREANGIIEMINNIHQ